MSIYTKLLAVKSAGITLKRDTKAFNYKYATLDQIQSKLGEVLEKEKLLVLHLVRNNRVVTQIIDTETAELVESEIEINTLKPQDKGSEITYYRRYNLLSLLDLEVEDDDGKKAQDSGTKKKDFSEPSNTNIAKKQGDYSQLELTEWISLFKDEKDINHLQTLWLEFNKLRWSEKQMKWALETKDAVKQELIK